MSKSFCIPSELSAIKHKVASCFLDASKAYDRVNHWALSKKLLKRLISVIILFIYIHTHKYFMVYKYI